MILRKPKGIAKVCDLVLCNAPAIAKSLTKNTPAITGPEQKNSSLLYELKGKLILRDFWSALCSYCIALFPCMQSVQDELKNQLQEGKLNSVFLIQKI